MFDYALSRAMRRRLHAGCVLSVALAGCGAARPLRVREPFPSRDALEALASAPVPPATPRPVAYVDAWSLDPASIGRPPTDAEANVAGAMKARYGLVDRPELACVAREHARFWLAHRAEPGVRLGRFLAAACGSTAPDVEAAHLEGEAPASTSDDELFGGARGGVELPEAVRGFEAGVAIAREGTRVVLVVVAARREAWIHVGAPEATGHVIVRGELAGGARDGGVAALIGRGAVGFARCERDPAPALPELAFACPLAPEDTTAWIEITARAPGDGLSRLVARALVRRDPAAPLAYAAGDRPKRPVASRAELAAALLDGVNEARARAGAPPLAPADKQSATNARLAPRFFAAGREGDAETAARIALGLVAGWDVDVARTQPGAQPIRRGAFFAAALPGTNDASIWLDAALETPTGRASLLDPDARRVAIGADTSGGCGAVVTTYAFFGSMDHRADADRLFARVAWLRAARGLPPPRRIAPLPELAAQARLAAAGQREPMDALAQGAGLEGQRMGRALAAWALVGDDLDGLALPPALFAPGPVSFGIEVTHLRPEGSAWGVYLVFVVATPPSNLGLSRPAPTRLTASRTRPLAHATAELADASNAPRQIASRQPLPGR